MIYPSLSTLLGKIDNNRYTLCILAGKRARQLISGSNKLVEFTSVNPVSVAINEINENKITFIKKK